MTSFPGSLAAEANAGAARPRDLRVVAPDAGRILLRNVYGWFERVAPGRYRLTPLGEAALQRWPETACEPLSTAAFVCPPNPIGPVPTG